MQQKFWTRSQVRELDRRASAEFGVPGVVLMENAGRGTAELLVSLGIRGRVAIGCGKGNNGGDGLVMARHLLNRGVTVSIFLFARPEELSEDAAINFHILQRSGVPMRLAAEPAGKSWEEELSRSEWVVDALFGTGLQGPVRPPLDRVLHAINAPGRRVLAVDIPSGLDCDFGLPLGETVRADHTATFVAPKAGYANPAAWPYLGKVHVVDIGLPPVLSDR